MKKLKNLLFILVLASCLLAISSPALAIETTPSPSDNPISGGVQKFGNQAFGQSEPIPIYVIIAYIVNSLLGIIGIVFLVLIIMAAFTWMTSMGEADKIKKAKGTITQATIGLIIIILSYAIANYVLTALQSTTTGGGGGTPTQVSP